MHSVELPLPTDKELDLEPLPADELLDYAWLNMTGDEYATYRLELSAIEAGISLISSLTKE